MSVKIRLMRLGRRNLPFFRVAVFDTRTRRDGRYLEALGSYDPRAADPKKKFTINVERARHWYLLGARPTEALDRLLRHAGLAGQITERKPTLAPAAPAVEKKAPAKKKASK